MKNPKNFFFARAYADNLNLLKIIFISCFLALIPGVSGASPRGTEISAAFHFESAFNLPAEDSLESNCTCPILYQAGDNSNCMNEMACPTILERIQQWKIEVSPHPITENFSVLINGAHPPRNFEFKIVDTENRVVLQGGETNGERLHLSAETLPPGQYLFQFSLNGRVVMMKRFLVYRN